MILWRCRFAIGRSATLWPRFFASGAIAIVCDENLRAIPQTVGAIDHDPVSRGKARVHRIDGSVQRAEIHGACRHRVISVDDINVGSGGPSLNRARRHGYDSVQHLEQEPGIDELVW